MKTFKKTLLIISLIGTTAVIAVMFLAIGYDEVIPGTVYRFKQLSGHELSEKIDKLGIRTIVNLRGKHPDKQWYQEEQQVAENKKVPLHNFKMNSKRLPDRTSLQKLIDVIINAEKPLLVHCHGGHERTGMAAAIALLLIPGNTLEQAYGQVSLKYFNYTDESVGRQFLNKYKAWLMTKNAGHSPRLLLEWVNNDYVDNSGNFRLTIDTINDTVVAEKLEQSNRLKVSIGSSEVQTLKISGWAIDALNVSPVKDVEVFLDDILLGKADYGRKRPDVAKFWDNTNFTNTGWVFDKDLHELIKTCYSLKIRLSRTNKESWMSPPKADICIN